MSSVIPVDAAEAVYSRWTTNWGTTTPYTFDNEDFEPPAPTSGTQWARVKVAHTTGAQATMGGAGVRRYDRGITVTIQLFDEVNAGKRTLLTLAQTARNIFEGVRFSGLWETEGVAVRDVGPDGEGWYLMVVEANLQYEETK